MVLKKQVLKFHRLKNNTLAIEVPHLIVGFYVGNGSTALYAVDSGSYTLNLTPTYNLLPQEVILQISNGIPNAHTYNEIAESDFHQPAIRDFQDLATNGMGHNTTDFIQWALVLELRVEKQNSFPAKSNN